jgi:hypothetical protein
MLRNINILNHVDSRVMTPNLAMVSNGTLEPFLLHFYRLKTYNANKKYLKQKVINRGLLALFISLMNAQFKIIHNTSIKTKNIL